jgi:methyl-accepting chemotaxis protein
LWVSTVLAAGLTRPLTSLERALEDVAAGDLSVRIEPQGPREVATLSERFNTMTESLSQAATRCNAPSARPHGAKSRAASPTRSRIF